MNPKNTKKKYMLATLGFTPERVIDPLAKSAGVDRLVVFHSKNNKCLAALQKVEKEANGTYRIPVERVQLSNPFDFEALVMDMRNTIEEIGEKNIVSFNVSAGTGLMSAAATFTAILYGLPMIYTREDTYEAIMLPLLKIDMGRLMTKKEHEIVRNIPEDGISISDLQDRIVSSATGKNISPATLSQHLKRMKKKGLVEIEVDKEDNRKKIVRISPSVRLVLT